MGPLYRSRRFQDTIQVNSPSLVSQSSSWLLGEGIADLLQKRAVERVQDLGTPGFYSWLFLIPKKNGKLRPVIDLSLLNQYIMKQPFKMETVKLVRQSILVHDWTVSIDLTDAYLHVPIHPRSRKYLQIMFGLSVHGLTFRNGPKSIDFYQTKRHYSKAHASVWLPGISIPRQLAYKRSNSQPTNISHKILPPNCTKYRFYSKSKEVRFNTSPEIHVYRDGISDTTEYSQSITGPSRFPTSDYQTVSFSEASLAQTFLSLLDKLSEQQTSFF